MLVRLALKSLREKKSVLIVGDARWILFSSIHQHLPLFVLLHNVCVLCEKMAYMIISEHFKLDCVFSLLSIGIHAFLVSLF